MLDRLAKLKRDPTEAERKEVETWLQSDPQVPYTPSQQLYGCPFRKSESGPTFGEDNTSCGKANTTLLSTASHQSKVDT
jgi:hypothetical protein